MYPGNGAYKVFQHDFYAVINIFQINMINLFIHLVVFVCFICKSPLVDPVPSECLML